MDMPTHVSCMLACIDCAQTCAPCMPCTCRPTTGARVQTVATLAAFSPRCADRVFGGSGLVPNIAIAGKKMCTSAITDEAWLPLRRRWLACTEARGCMALLLTPWLGPQGENTRRFLCERTYVECCIQPVLRGESSIYPMTCISDLGNSTDFNETNSETHAGSDSCYERVL